MQKIRNIGRRPIELTIGDNSVRILPGETSMEFAPEQLNDFSKEQLKKYVGDREAVIVPVKAGQPPNVENALDSSGKKSGKK